MASWDHKGAANQTLSSPASRPLILIVEDHAMLRALLCDWLGTVFPNCDYQQASSGETALTLAQTHPPDLVLMDLALPGINGIEATRAMRSLAPGAQVVILTIHEETEYQDTARAVGAAGFVSKRQMHDKLIPLMASLLARPEHA